MRQHDVCLGFLQLFELTALVTLRLVSYTQTNSLDSTSPYMLTPRTHSADLLVHVALDDCSSLELLLAMAALFASLLLLSLRAAAGEDSVVPALRNAAFAPGGLSPLHVFLAVHWRACMFVCLFLHLFVCRSVCVSLFLFLSLSLSVSLCVKFSFSHSLSP